MLRRTNTRRQQSASESTDEKHGAWAQDRDGAGRGIFPPASPSLSLSSGSDDHPDYYLLATTATAGKNLQAGGNKGGATTTTGGGGGGPHHHQYKRMPSYTLNRNAVWLCGGGGGGRGRSLSSQSSSGCITIQELRQRNNAAPGRRRCADYSALPPRLLLGASVALCVFLVREIGGSLRAVRAMEERRLSSADDVGGGGLGGALVERCAAATRRAASAGDGECRRRAIGLLGAGGGGGPVSGFSLFSPPVFVLASGPHR